MTRSLILAAVAGTAAGLAAGYSLARRTSRPPLNAHLRAALGTDRTVLRLACAIGFEVMPGDEVTEVAASVLHPDGTASVLVMRPGDAFVVVAGVPSDVSGLEGR